MTIREWLDLNCANYETDDDLRKACVDELGISRGSFWRIYRNYQASPQGGTSKKSAKSTSSPIGMSKNQFLREFDSETKTRLQIEEGIKRLGRDQIVKDYDFRTQLAGVTSTQCWKAVSEEFNDYRIVVNNAIHWAQPETVQWAVSNVAKARKA